MPRCRLQATQIHRWEHEQPGTAAECLRTRARRLKEAKRPYTVDGTTVTFTDVDGAEVTLTYSDIDGGER